MKNTILEEFNVEEEFLYNNTYLFIKGYASGLELHQTLKALPLARCLHNGQYRKGITVINDIPYHLPYVLHVLKVCSTLISLKLCLSKEELDTLLAASLLHDVIEDCKEHFPDGGNELTTRYGFNPEVYLVVKSVSKLSGLNEEQLNEYFNEIKRNKLSLLIKLADRSHNVEDLYNMKPEKLHRYVEETRTWIYSLANYGKSHYPELSNGLNILKSKIVSLTECTETVVEVYETLLKQKDKEIEDLKIACITQKGKE